MTGNRTGLVVALLFASLLLSGALGLRMPEECESDPSITRNSERMNCYYSSALTLAYLCGTYNPTSSGTSSSTSPGPVHCARAINICDDIWTIYGTAAGASNDQKRKAELVSNSCFFEVARITRDSYVCGYIGQDRGTLSHQLTGDQVTKETCMDETERLAGLAPDRYYSPGRNNICSLVFVLPLFVFCVLGLGFRGRGG
jgi:hypothetical protein